MVTLLKYDDLNKEIIIDNPGLLLVEEFEKLLKRDKFRVFKELKYIFLMLDWRSPFADYVEQDRHTAAIETSHLTEEEFQDLDFRAACRKFKTMQESALEYRLLQSAKGMVEKFIIYFDTADPTELDPETRKPIYKVKDIMAEISSLSKVIDELDKLEFQFKKQVAAPKATRGGIQEGFDPRRVTDG